jgi:hypothetical protein
MRIGFMFGQGGQLTGPAMVIPANGDHTAVAEATRRIHDTDAELRDEPRLVKKFVQSTEAVNWNKSNNPAYRSNRHGKSLPRRCGGSADRQAGRDDSEVSRKAGRMIVLIPRREC